MQRLDVTMLGGFQLAVDGDVVPPIPSRQARSLLAYLLLHRDRHHRREHLVGLLWPDMPESKARRRLSHTLWQLQDVLGETRMGIDLINATVDHVRIHASAPVHLDVELFEQECERHRPDRQPAGLQDRHGLDQAVDRYQGELLVGHDDDWIEPDRERLRQLHLVALGWLVSVAKGQGATEDALVYARRITIHDPLREDAHREVMRLYALLGRTSEALRQFERCRSVLLEEMDTEPSQDTINLVRFIERQRDREVALSPADTPDFGVLRMVGRDWERRVLVDAMERVLSGHSAVVLVEGDAGMGCSRLLWQSVEDARWRNITTLAASGRDRPRPFGAVVEAINRELTPIRLAHVRADVDAVWRRDAARLIPELVLRGAERPGRLEGPEARERLIESMTRVATSMLAMGPSLLVLDAVHQMDDESLEVIDRLASRQVPEGMGVVAGSRHGEVRDRTRAWSTLRSLDGLVVPDRVALRPLSAADTARLVQSAISGSVPLRFSTRIHEETGGNPLFIMETLRAIHADGIHDLDDLAALPLPTSVRDVVTTSMARFDDRTLAVLHAAAVFATDVVVETLAAALEVNADVVAGPVARLVKEGLLRLHDDQLAFVHDQVRRVVLEVEDDPDVRRGVARLLRELHPDRIGEVADIFASVGDLPEALTANADAGRHALSVHAFDEARTRFRRALDLQSGMLHNTVDRVSLLWEYEEVLAHLAARDDQADVLAELRTLADGTDEQSRVWRRIAMHAGETGDVDAAVEAAQRALDLAATDQDRGLALVAAGSARFWHGDAAAAIPQLEEATRLLDGRVDEGHARATLGDARRTVDQLDEAILEFERAIELSAEHDAAQLEVRALGNLAATHIARHDPAAAHVALRRSITLAREIGYLRGQVIALGNLSFVDHMRADLASALDHLDDATALAISIGEARLEATCLLNASDLRRLVGEVDKAREEAERAAAWFDQVDDQVGSACAATSLAADELQRGEVTAATARLEPLHGRPLPEFVRVQLVPVAVDAAIATGDLELAARWLEDAPDSPQVHAAAARLALATRDPATAADRIALARQASEGMEATPLLDVLWTAWQVAIECSADPSVRLREAHGLVEALLAPLGPEHRVALSELPRVGDILAAAASQLPLTVAVDLARADAPMGRELSAEEFQRVTVTITPIDAPDERRRCLVAVLEQIRAQGASATVEDLSNILQVSTSTVRRDLSRLRSEGIEVDTRGSRSA